MFRKVYVTVTVRYDETGKAHPLSILFEDGVTYPIDRVLDTRPAASMKVGGCGMRYTCRIGGREAFLFEEESRWYVEAK